MNPDKKHIFIAISALFLLLTCCGTSSKEKFQDSYSSLKSIRSSAKFGIRYYEFGILIIKLSDELFKIDKEDLNKHEMKLYKLFDDVRTTYLESYRFWNIKPEREVDGIPGGFIFYPDYPDYPRYKNEKVIFDFVKRYNLQPEKVQNLTRPKVYYDCINVSSALTRIWQKANETANEIDLLYNKLDD